MIYLALVTHDPQSNTLEAVFCENNGVEVKRINCKNYSQEQKAEFEADVGIDAAKYILMAGW